MGTGGTITGVGEVLKERNPECRVVAVEPASSAVLSGGAAGAAQDPGIGAGFVPPVLNRDMMDEIIPVPDEDAIETAAPMSSPARVSSAGISSGSGNVGLAPVGPARPSRRASAS